MRTATAETVRALRRAIGDAPYSRWATANGLSKADVHQALNGRSMSATRENRIRAVLGLPPLRWQMVEIAENQRVVTVTKPRPKVRRAVALHPCEAAEWDAHARAAGYRSVGALLRSIMADRLNGNDR